MWIFCESFVQYNAGYGHHDTVIDGGACARGKAIRGFKSDESHICRRGRFFNAKRLSDKPVSQTVLGATDSKDVVEPGRDATRQEALSRGAASSCPSQAPVFFVACRI